MNDPLLPHSVKLSPVPSSYRFRHGAWYWGAILLIRNTLAAASTALNPKNPFFQMCFLLTVLLSYAFAQILVWPWRTVALNSLDMLSNACLIFMTFSAMPFASNFLENELQSQATRGVVIFWAGAITPPLLHFVGICPDSSGFFLKDYSFFPRFLVSRRGRPE